MNAEHGSRPDRRPRRYRGAVIGLVLMGVAAGGHAQIPPGNFAELGCTTDAAGSFLVYSSESAGPQGITVPVGTPCLDALVAYAAGGWFGPGVRTSVAAFGLPPGGDGRPRVTAYWRLELFPLLPPIPPLPGLPPPPPPPPPPEPDGTALLACAQDRAGASAVFLSEAAGPAAVTVPVGTPCSEALAGYREAGWSIELVGADLGLAHLPPALARHLPPRASALYRMGFTAPIPPVPPGPTPPP